MTRTTAKLVLAVAAVCFAHAAVAKSSDRRQTMRVQAGNVHIVQGSLVIEAARADIRQGDGDIQSARLTGSPVKLRQEMDNGGTMNATAAQVDYDLRQDTVVFTGGAVVQQPGRGSI